MVTAIGNPHDPTSTAAGVDKCDLVIQVSDFAGPDSQPRIRQTCEWIAGMFPDLRTLIAYPSGDQPLPEDAASSSSGQCRAVAYPPEPQAVGTPQIRSRQDYKNAFTLAQSADARACILLASDLLSSSAPAALASPILDGKLDFVVSFYKTSPFEGLVNNSILFPLSHVISGSAVRYPLAPDVALSPRAQATLSQQSMKSGGDQGQAPILWPVLDLELAGLKVGQVPVGHKTQVTSGNMTLEDLITEVVGSLFTEIEAKASLWQRNPLSKQGASQSSVISNATGFTAPDPLPLVESFKLGSSNLQEIWRLVLPPHSLLALKRLAKLPAQDFQMPDSLWVRIVYDFLLAHKSRTMSRKHLLGALTPLYLGWVASYVMAIARTGQDKVEERIGDLATAFEIDRPYLVSQWRWPDRFNP